MVNQFSCKLIERAAVSILCLPLIETMEEKDGDSESIYMNIDDNEKKDDEREVRDRIYLNSAAGKTGSQAVSEDRQVCSGNPAAVGLGLLCVLLLAVTIGLSVKHNGERDQLWSSYINMTMEREQLQSSYINMTMEREQLQTSYINMTMERDQLQSGCNEVSVERDQLQSRFDSLSKERDQLLGTNNRLQRSNDVLTIERDLLQRQLTQIRACPSGWTRFMSSCYYVSSNGKTWEQSRQDCRGNGADLVIINSKEEQDFVSGLGKSLKSWWIGLTDQAVEGRWKWVDGTSLGTGYWLQGEPNNAKYDSQGEDCAEMLSRVRSSATTSGWNDVPCSNVISWICEKMT
ncbi:hypothetical protein NFI96_027211 [Prochilodus magdalenae]|nr:hypothetical protein NFI96_027211 [Prochilodus magdalenae]